MSGDSITLEMAEERELWATVFAASHTNGSDQYCMRVAQDAADNAVRAYRERLPERGGHERSVIVPCPGCRNDVLVRVVNGRVDDPWCCDCLTEQAPDERTETDVAPGPLSRGEVNGALADNGVNLEVKPWPTEPSGAPEAPGWRSAEWAGPCARGDAGKLQTEVERLRAERDTAEHEVTVALTKRDRAEAELTALREQLGELADGLQRRRSECESLANAPRPMPTASRARCRGKASAYGHAAELLRAALHEDS